MTEQRNDTQADDAEFLAAIVATANENGALMDGTTDPVRKIIDSADVVFGVWQDRKCQHGVDTLIIKGRRRLEAIAAMQPSPKGAVTLPINRIKWSAIRCVCAEQAVATRQVFGDGE